MAAETLFAADGDSGVAVNVRDDGDVNPKPKTAGAGAVAGGGCFSVSLPFVQKVIAELLGTYFLVFAGCGAVQVNADKDKVVTLPGVAIVWGLAVMVMIYAVGHISGAHLNPAVTIAFATCRRFSWRQVPGYVAAQVIGSTLAAGTLRLLFSGPHDQFTGTVPVGSNIQSLVLEFIITFYLMFVVSGVATDNRAVGELAGLAVGSTVLLNVLFAGATSGGSMNPARSLGPALVSSEYKSIWVYMLGPTAGAISGAWIYNFVRFHDHTSGESFLKLPSRANPT